MSKLDDMRAMREARYEAARARAGKAPAAQKAKPLSMPRTEKVEAAPEAASEAPSEELCGHRNMGGRTCTREKGHAAKSHRYS